MDINKFESESKSEFILFIELLGLIPMDMEIGKNELLNYPIYLN